MPFIRITVLSPTLTTDQVARLQQGTTQFMATGMRKPIVGIAVLVEHVVSAGWSIAGRSGAVAAHVEAIIGQGTNTTDEKARFNADMWKLLGCSIARTNLGRTEIRSMNDSKNPRRGFQSGRPLLRLRRLTIPAGQ